MLSTEPLHNKVSIIVLEFVNDLIKVYLGYIALALGQNF